MGTLDPDNEYDQDEQHTVDAFEEVLNHVISLENNGEPPDDEVDQE